MGEPLVGRKHRAPATTTGAPKSAWRTSLKWKSTGPYASPGATPKDASVFSRTSSTVTSVANSISVV